MLLLEIKSAAIVFQGDFLIALAGNVRSLNTNKASEQSVFMKLLDNLK